jgi:hypothetical protein
MLPHCTRKLPSFNKAAWLFLLFLSSQAATWTFAYSEALDKRPEAHFFVGRAAGSQTARKHIYFIH